MFLGQSRSLYLSQRVIAYGDVSFLPIADDRWKEVSSKTSFEQLARSSTTLTIAEPHDGGSPH